MKIFTQDELLRQIFIHKIKEDWAYHSKRSWKQETWFKTYQKNTKNHNDDFPDVQSLPNGFFEYLETDLSIVISEALQIRGRELSYYTSSVSSLKRFLGKNRDGHKRFQKKKIGLAIYSGYRNGRFHFKKWEDFAAAHTYYTSFWKTWVNRSIHKKLPSTKSTNLVFPSITTILAASNQPQKDACDQWFFSNLFVQQNSNSIAKKISNFNPILYVFASIFLVFFLGKSKLWTNLWNSSPLTSAYYKTNTEPVFKTVKMVKGENRFTVWVAYDIKSLPLRSIEVIANGDTNKKRILPTVSKDTISFIFHKPQGNLYLKSHGDVIKKIEFNIKTTEWIGWVQGPDKNKKRMYSAYHDQCEIIKDGVLQYPETYIPSDLKNYYFFRFLNRRNFGIDAGSLQFEIRFKLSKIPSDATCNNILFQLLDNETVLYGNNFELEGCEFYTGLTVGDIHISSRGKKINNKLEKNISLGIENFTYKESFYRKWNTFKIQTRKNKVHYYLNGKKIYELPVQRLSGLVQGLRISGKGSWMIDQIKMSDLNGKKYIEDFSNCDSHEVHKNNPILLSYPFEQPKT